MWTLRLNIKDNVRKLQEKKMSKFVHVLGFWTIPPLIVNDNAFRRQINKLSTSTYEIQPQGLGLEN